MRCLLCFLPLFAMSMAAPVKWTEHANLNCYSGAGALTKTSSDMPVKSLTLEACQQVCTMDPACVAVTRERGQKVGNCWLRVAVELDSCEGGVAFNTYTNGRNPFQWIADIERTGGRHVLPPGTYFIDRQYVLPSNTHLEGAGEENTFIHAVKYNAGQGQALCGPYHVNRIGIIVGDNTYVGKFTFTGADWQRPGDNGDLCGGGAIETPGCAFPYCAQPHSDTDEKGPNINTGKGDGNGVSGVVIEDIVVIKNTVQNMVFMAQTPKGMRVSSDITVRNLRTTGTWADGLNIHGAHKNILVEGCSASNTGDDSFAAWDTAVEGEYMTNITFKNNYASNPHFNGNDRDCFSQFGGRSVNYIGNTCEKPTNAMIHFWIQFCGSGQAGSPGTSACYPADSVSYISGNTLKNSGKPQILRDAWNLPKINTDVSLV